VAHAGWSVAQLACLAQIWRAVAGRRRSPAVWGSVALLGAEGAALVIGRGSCPMGSMQARWGDPVPFFELVLPARAAKAAVPVLFIVAAAALSGLAVQPPGLRLRAGA
jgi:hypothetical protein